MSLLSKSIEIGGLPGCPIAAALDIVGDRWTLLVLRDLSRGVTRFNDLRDKTGAPRDSLRARLCDLESAGLITRRRYCEHPPRYEYSLTEAGRSLLPMLAAMEHWGRQYT